MIRAEESRRSVMLEPPSKGSALVFIKNPNGGHKPNTFGAKSDDRASDNPSKQSNHDGLWCTYCKKPCHTMDNYFKLHGKAQVLSRIKRFKGQQQNQANFINK